MRNGLKAGIIVLQPLLALLFLLMTAGNAAAVTGNKQVLILNSYHQGYTWGDNETAGIMAALSAAAIKSDVNIEYLDTKRFPDQKHFPQLVELFRAKKSLLRPDLVLTADDPAFDFAIKYRKVLFANVPLVFIGVNEFNPAMLQGEKNVTGAVERQDFRGTVEVALTLQPETREVVVVHDYTPSGLATQREVINQLTPLSGRISFRFLPSMTINEVIAALSELRSGSIVLAVSFGADKAGRVFNHDELAKILSEKSPVPVYSTKVERLGHGIVGGSLMNGSTHGYQGGELALAVLQRGSATNVPVVENPRNELMFDYRQMVRFKIPLKRLPSGSKLVNQPQSFYAQHNQVINIAALIVGVLSACLIMIVIANQRRLKAERELSESKSYQVLFDNASDPIFILDAQGRILESSSVAQDILKLTAEDLQNRVLTELVSAADAIGLLSFLEQVQKEGKGLFKTSFIMARGDAIPVEISSRTITYRGAERVFCSARDIRERVQYEEKLHEINSQLEQRIKERTLELEISNKELESFCYSVSHDLRAPLRHIRSYCSLLSDDHTPDLNKEAQHFLHRICNASNHMGQLIDDLLNLSQVSLFEIKRSSINLSDLGKEILAELSQADPERHITWQVEEGLEVNGDPQLLRIALVNLLNNAWKYTGKCTEPNIELGQGVASSGATAFYVRDNGAGFDMQHACKLFTPFQRLHNETDYPGTGIGLATVARIIHRHGGKIWAEAVEGQGATFWFTLEESIAH